MYPCQKPIKHLKINQKGKRILPIISIKSNPKTQKSKINEQTNHP
jgi:hypothetical protein